MKRFLLISVVFALTVLCVVCDVHDFDEHDESLDSQWEKFKKTFNKKFTENGNEEAKRRLIFKKTLAHITDHNQRADLGEYSYRLGINHLSDMTPEEIGVNMKGSNDDATNQQIEMEKYEVPQSNKPLPRALDWRKKGWVSLVKNQVRCYAEWAYAFTGALEGQYINKTGVQLRLSDQQVIDCSNDYGNRGCRMGTISNACEYARVFGIEKEADYQRTDMSGRCHYNKNKVVIKPLTCSTLKVANEANLQAALVSHGPVAVVITACSNSFPSFKSGIYNKKFCWGRERDFPLLVVGYDSNYWLAKGSFGRGWGENGYIKIERGEGKNSGITSNVILVHV